MTKKERLLHQLNEQLQKGEIKDASIITKVELADEKLVDIFMEKAETLRKSQEASKEDAAEEQAE
jgi:hypothetical protein